MIVVVTKVCLGCKVEKPQHEFYKNGSYYFPRCKECHRQYTAKATLKRTDTLKEIKLKEIKARASKPNVCPLCGKPKDKGAGSE